MYRMVAARVAPADDPAGMNHGLVTERLTRPEPWKSYKAAFVEKERRAAP
jgi:hypothetical protein